MTDPVPDSKPSTRWLWVALLVLLAIALIIFVFNADGDEELETIPDGALTTQEERLNTELPVDQEELPPIRGAEGATGSTADPTSDANAEPGLQADVDVEPTGEPIAE